MNRPEHRLLPSRIVEETVGLRLSTFNAAFIAIVLFATACVADPCGMVPPVYLQGQVDLQRIGLQKTFVFHKDGIETFVIRPGFQGSVEEFGMLIPFPSPPTLRKVPDEIFAHIAAAIDPPEVVVDLTPMTRASEFGGGLGDVVSDVAPASMAERELKVDEIHVLNQEAVGMYEVAVLQAGSARVLNKWMTDHGYRYPDGMDDVCTDYVNDDWCFVAVKARVGQKAGVDPRPGMNAATGNLPSGAKFDGHVQGMGFRFKTEELVVPMRLSAFNEGDLHNVVYLLTEHPMKGTDLPAQYVVRQVSGKQLLQNLTDPLPLRIIGGEYEDIPERRKRQLKVQRDPTPHNGIAKQLFAGDLVTARTKQLSHPHEELEKELLDIGERLGLRGPEIDARHTTAIESVSEGFAKDALGDLQSLTMTVLDGEFERDVVAADNVYFTRFDMNPARNNAQRYNARLFGPSPVLLQNGSAAAVLRASRSVAVTHPSQGRLILQDATLPVSAEQAWLKIGGVFLAAAFFCVVLVRRKRGSSAAGAILICLCISEAYAQNDSVSPTQEQIQEMLSEIHDSSDRSGTIDRIAAQGKAAVPALLQLIKSGEQIEDRGWAVVCLNAIGGQQVDQELQSLSKQGDLPPLIRIWSASAAINQQSNLQALTPYVQLAAQFPSLKRPLDLRINELISANEIDMESVLRLCSVSPATQQTLAPVILKDSPDRLAKVLMSGSDVSVRRQAAAWLATMKVQGVQGVNASVIKAVTFRQRAENVPWGDGPLFIPGVNWEKAEAISLINELTLWYVRCAKKNQADHTSKIITNLNSRQLMNAAGFRQVPGDVLNWLMIWRNVIGAEKMEELMQRTGYRLVPTSLVPNPQ